MFTGTPTPNLKLPIFEPCDHPDFLTDFNEAFRRIDDNAYEVQKKLAQFELRVSTLEEKVARLESQDRLQSAAKEQED